MCRAQARPDVIGAAVEERSEAKAAPVERPSVRPCLRLLLHGVAIAIVVALVVCAVGGVILMAGRGIEIHWNPLKSMGMM